MFSRHRIATPKIVQPGSGRRKSWLVLVVLLLSVWSWFVYDYAQKHAGADIALFHQEKESLEVMIEQQQKQIEKLRLEVATSKRAAQVDKTAAILARQDLKIFQQEKSELKHEVQFLNSLLSDKSKKAVVRLKYFKLEKTEQENEFILAFTLAHFSKVGGTVKGSLVIEIDGELGQKPVKLPFKQLIGQRKKIKKLRFKNFQKFEKRFTLPEDFVPKTVIVSAKFTNKGIEQLSETFPWK